MSEGMLLSPRSLPKGPTWKRSGSGLIVPESRSGRGVTALGGKAQVQFYAQRASGDPDPLFVISDGEARLNGSLLLPGSVLQARADTHFGASGFIEFNQFGEWFSGWIDVAVFDDVVIDEYITAIDHVLQPGPLTVQLLSSSSFTEFWDIYLHVRMLRNGSVVWPSPTATNGSEISETLLEGNSVTEIIFFGNYLQYLEFGPSPGTVDYKWQVQIEVLSSQEDDDDMGSNWSFEGSQARMLIPRNEI